MGFTLPRPLACLLQTTTSYHRTPVAQRGSEARPLVYQTLMALFSSSEPFAVEPSTLQESNWTWRPGAHSHRFHTTGTGQISPKSLAARVNLFAAYFIVKEVVRCFKADCIGGLLRRPLQYPRQCARCPPRVPNQPLKLNG